MLVTTPLLALTFLSVAHAIELPLIRRVPSPRAFSSRSMADITQAGNSSGLGLMLFDGDDSDSNYLVEIKLGGQPFRVLVDTGSSDLWLGNVGPSVNLTNTTTVPVNMLYVDHSSLYGTVAFSELQIGQFTIPSQAFINPTHVNITSNVLEVCDGLIGLSFDSTSSVNRALQEAYGGDITIGRTPLSNIFAQNPDIPRCVDIHLHRSLDPSRIGNGTLFIGEHSAMYEDIMNQPTLRTVREGEWTVTMDGMTVNGKAVPLGGRNASSNVTGNPPPVSIDSGASFGVITEDMFNAIYSSVSGAIFLGRRWVMPCLSSANVTFSFGGLQYPIHPLDLTEPMTIYDEDVQRNVTACFSVQFTVTQDLDVSEGKLILGDTFLKNVYASYNFGDRTSSSTSENGSYIQLLSTTNASQAWADFLVTRAQTLKSSPPEADLSLELAQSSSSSTSSSYLAIASSSIAAMASVTSTTQPPVGNTELSSPSIKFDGGSSQALGSLSDEPPRSDNSILTSLARTYGIATVILLSANLFIGLVLCALGIMVCLRGKREKQRMVHSSYAPVHLKEPDGESIAKGIGYED